MLGGYFPRPFPAIPFPPQCREGVAGMSQGRRLCQEEGRRSVVPTEIFSRWDLDSSTFYFPKVCFISTDFLTLSFHGTKIQRGSSCQSSAF